MLRLQFYSKRIILSVLLLFISNSKPAFAQNKPANFDSTKLGKVEKQKPEIFTSGFIDIMNSGQVNASARFIKLYIHRPAEVKGIPCSRF